MNIFEMTLLDILITPVLPLLQLLHKLFGDPHQQIAAGVGFLVVSFTSLVFYSSLLTAFMLGYWLSATFIYVLLFIIGLKTGY